MDSSVCPAENSASLPSCIRNSNAYNRQIRQLWLKRKPVYLQWVRDSQKKPYNLYNIQIETNNLLKYAGYCRDSYLLAELVSLYIQALGTLDETYQYVFYYYPQNRKRSIHSLANKHKMWLDVKKPVGDESILASSQFLYLISETINIIAGLTTSQRTLQMLRFVQEYVPIFIDHYNRWVFTKPGPFQVRGWGCRVNGNYVVSGMNHFEFLKRKLVRTLGDDQSPSYCNAVTDTDMWIIAGVVNLLAAHEKNHVLVPLQAEDYKRLRGYIELGVDLLKSRFTYKPLKDFNGRPVEGANFDLGAWDDHADFYCTGYTKETYPYVHSFLHLYRRLSNVGWDISHARRFVHVFEAIFQSREVLHLDFPTRPAMIKLTNQLVYGTFNLDFKKPLLTNFMDGTNGWYRVGYRGRIGFGYGPWDMSVVVLTGGYGFWSKYNRDLGMLFAARKQVVGEGRVGSNKNIVFYP